MLVEVAEGSRKRAKRGDGSSKEEGRGVTART
jgi:hypothetical protein